MSAVISENFNDPVFDRDAPYCRECGRQTFFEKRLVNYNSETGFARYKLVAICPNTRRTLTKKVPDPHGEYYLEEDGYGFVSWDWKGFEDYYNW